MVVSLVLAGIVHAQTNTHKYQSVFIYSFTRHIQWPEADADGEFNISVLGDSDIMQELNYMAQTKKVGARSIKVTRVNSVDDIKKCHILYIPQNMSSQLAGALAKAGVYSTLVITEEPGLGAKGSHINFIIKDGKLAFELNQGALDKQGLKASMEITRLAILI